MSAWTSPSHVTAKRPKCASCTTEMVAPLPYEALRTADPPPKMLRSSSGPAYSSNARLEEGVVVENCGTVQDTSVPLTIYMSDKLISRSYRNCSAFLGRAQLQWTAV